MSKTTCPVSRSQFTTHAKPLAVSIGNQVITANAKQFATGSFGWYANGKVTVMVDGVPVTVQIGLNLTVVGSKELPSAPVLSPTTGLVQGSAESIQAAVSSPSVQAIIAASKAKAAQEAAPESVLA